MFAGQVILHLDSIEKALQKIFLFSFSHDLDPEPARRGTSGRHREAGVSHRVKPEGDCILGLPRCHGSWDSKAYRE